MVDEAPLLTEIRLVLTKKMDSCNVLFFISCTVCSAVSFVVVFHVLVVAAVVIAVIVI